MLSGCLLSALATQGGCKSAGSEDGGAQDQAVADAGGCPTTKCLNPNAVCCYTEACVDTTSDPMHCGSCGNSCGAAETCQNSTCLCTATTDMGTTNTACATGSTCCADPADPGCKALATDPNNCGFCAHQCNAMETCQNGSCVCGKDPDCTNGQTCCGSGCADTSTNVNNCGQCGHACPANTPCMMGVCEGECPKCLPIPHVQKCCGFACLDLLNDPMNCGDCGVVCKPFLNGPPTCRAGICLELHLDGGTHDM